MLPDQERRTCVVGILAGLCFAALLLVLVPQSSRAALESDVALLTKTAPTRPTTPAATPTAVPTATPTVAPTATAVQPLSRRPPCYSDPSHANITTLLNLEGVWLDTPEYHVPYTFRPQECRKYVGIEAGDSYRQPSSKAFAPFACSLERFSASEFVGLLDNRTLFVVGDSLSSYFFNAMMCLVAKPPTMKVVKRTPPKPPCVPVFVCVELTDTAAKPSPTARLCFHRTDQEIGVSVWALNNEGLLKPNDVVLANTGRHKIDHSPPRLHELISQMPKDIRGDGNTNSIDSRMLRFRKAHEFVTSEFKRKRLQPPLFLYRTTYAAKYVNGDWEPNAKNRECTSDPKWIGLEKQQRVGLEQARQAGLDTLDPFMASTLVNKTEYNQGGDCSHFAVTSIYIYTAELLLAYLKHHQ